MPGTWNGDNYYGDTGNDIATGNGNANYMTGGEGNDNLDGAGGDDRIYGDIGNDDLQGGDGNDQLTDYSYTPNGYSGLIGHDTLRGGTGDDVLYFNSPDTGDQGQGGSGVDTAVVSFVYGATTTDFPVSFVLGDSSIVYLNSIATVALNSIEKIGIYGSKGNDFLAGGDLNDTLGGDAGNDVLRGNGGNDIIYDAGGQIDIDGGAGVDTAYLDFSSASGNFNLLVGNGNTVNLGALGAIKNVEIFGSVTTGSYDDQVRLKQDMGASVDVGYGDDKVTIVGLGNDAINGRDGADTIDSGAGDDEVDPGYGADLVHLGDGNDELLYYWVTANRTDTAADTIFGEAGNDYITTPAAADLIDGGTGDDSIYSGRGADHVEGGDGNDEISGEGGGDRLEGGIGNDVVESDYDHYFDEITEDDDLLLGGDGDDTLTAGVGQDTIDGGDGDDIVGVSHFKVDYNNYDSWEMELSKVDVVRGGAGVDALQIWLPSGINVPWEDDDTAYRVVLGAKKTTVLADGSAAAIATGVERILFTGWQAGDHYIVGGALADKGLTGDGDSYVNLKGGNDTIGSKLGSDTLLAGDGDDSGSITFGGRDRIDMGAGNDTLTADNWYTHAEDLAVLDGVYDGGAGFDTIAMNFNYQDSGGPVWTFDGQRVRLGDDVAFRIINFESFSYSGALYQGAYDGGAANDSVDLYWSGASTVSGGGGADTLRGSNAGGDSIDGGRGNDSLAGNGGNDTLHGGSGADRFVFNSALNASTNVDQVTDFETGRDTIELNNAYFFGLFDGAVQAYQFHVGAAATDPNQRLIYDDATGNLYYDSNGNQAGGQTLFAVLDVGLDLKAGDFWVV